MESNYIYNTIEDLPIIHDHPYIDPDKLGEYSTELLQRVREELNKTITNIEANSVCSAPPEDETVYHRLL